MNKNQLFRQEAIENRLNRSLGIASVNIPVRVKLTATLLCVLFILVLIFIAFVPFSERLSVRGFIDSEKGVASIYSSSNGIVVSSHITEAKHVIKNQNLMVISAEFRFGNSETFQNTEKNLKRRQNNLNMELKLKSDLAESLLLLYKKHFVSIHQLNEVKAEVLELENKVKTIDFEILTVRQKQFYTIKSPIDGVITNIQYKKGQYTDASKLLFQIIPDNSALIARLYVPAQHIGYIKKGSVALLKYDSYPSQRFGAYNAIIKEVNLTILNDNNEEKPFSIGQAYYKAEAELQQSYVKIYGLPVKLNHGMAFTAIIPGQKKSILKWIFDPIHSYIGEHSV